VLQYRNEFCRGIDATAVSEWLPLVVTDIDPLTAFGCPLGHERDIEDFTRLFGRDHWCTICTDLGYEIPNLAENAGSHVKQFRCDIDSPAHRLGCLDFVLVPLDRSLGAGDTVISLDQDTRSSAVPAPGPPLSYSAYKTVCSVYRRDQLCHPT
jgi:hypothetical protein